MKIISINAGIFHCDGGAIFGVVPKKVWERRYPCNDDNYCKMFMRCLFIDTGDKRILIDTGCGSKQLEYLKFYKISEIVDFETELQKHGYSCNDITDVILTHLHFDHCGGCTFYKDNEIQLTFPNATHWVGKMQWENFLNPNIREGDSYFKENMLPIEKANKLRLLSQNQFLTPGIELRIFNGHTQGQIVVLIDDSNQEKAKTMYVGDVIPTATSIPIAWISAYDTNPLVAMTEKENLLKEAAENGYTLFFEHDAYIEKCKIKEINGKFRAEHI